MTTPDITGTGPNITDSELGCFIDESSRMTGCVVDGVFSAGPAPSLMGLLMSGVLLTSLYIAGDGDLVVPSVVTMLLGSAFVPLLPPQYVTFTYSFLAIGVASTIFAVWIRYTNEGRF